VKNVQLNTNIIKMKSIFVLYKNIFNFFYLKIFLYIYIIMVDYKFLFMTKESFRFVKNYENYMISNEGRVFSIKRNKFLKPILNDRGYYIVDLYTNGLVKRFRVHRLVSRAFLDNNENKRCIDHINNIKTDNRLENLRWCSYTENNRNTTIRKDNTSGIKGISFNKQINKYCAYIRINKKKKHIGYFTTLEQATIARKKVANELFGEFTNACEKY
jgi:hypothetical protein